MCRQESFQILSRCWPISCQNMFQTLTGIYSKVAKRHFKGGIGVSDFSGTVRPVPVCVYSIKAYVMTLH